MKKLFKILLGLLILALIFLGVFLGVNLWPRKVEPPLWTEADLALPQEKDQNGYYYMLQIQDSPIFEGMLDKISDGMEVPGDLDPFTPQGFPQNATDRTLFWMEAKGLQPIYSAFVEKHRPAIEEYEKLLAFPQFVDQSPVSLEATEKPRWLFFMDLHKIGSMHIFNQLLKGNTDAAYAFWLKMFEQDVSLLKSARRLLTHMIALSVVKGNLSLLDGIRQFPPSPDLQEKIKKSLEDFDPSPLDLRRAVITEYLEHQAAADSVTGAQKKEKALWPRIGFNRAVFQRDENDYFRRLDAVRKDPKSINEATERQFEMEEEKIRYAAGGSLAEMMGGKHNPFWWFFNPSGKLLRMIVTVNFVDRISQFHEQLEEVKKLRSRFLAGPLFSPPPETQPETAASVSEKRPNEAQPSEAQGPVPDTPLPP